MESSRPFNVPLRLGVEAAAGAVCTGAGAGGAETATAGSALARSPVRTRSLGGGKLALPADIASRRAIDAARPLRAEMRAEDMS